MDTIKRILVLSSSTKECKKALHYGIALARQYHLKLFVLHVMENPFGLDGWNLPIPSLKAEYENLIKKTRQEIDQMIKREQTEGLEITEWVHEGKPVREVTAIVKKEKIDLIILSAHEEGRLEHYLFGRTVEELTRIMPASVFVVKADPYKKIDR